ncbi:MAG: tryptophan--tRNA ligase [Dehalococcoidales bacterium]|nr:tryptophan--tRNA ligase [Dehalococcoidales bacterium]
MKGRVFSGARPTGRQHIGNYLGAIQNYVQLQEEYNCIYSIVDLHALTTLESTADLRSNTNEMLLDWLAAGMDPGRSIIFAQSHVPEHAELHTLLSMITPMTWLTRLPTFKEKVRMHPENVNYGLLGYPVLMTADIILYKADTVPVGDDQLPHLELAREIVRRFEYLFGPLFPEPAAKLTTFPRVMGVDGVQKMSKSLDNHIELSASAEETTKRVMTMVTDTSRVYRRDPGHPEVCNVFTLHGFYNPERRPEIERDCRSAALGCVDCKRLLAEGMNAALAPFRARRAELAAQPDLIDDVLGEGARRARAIAVETMVEVRDKMGLQPRRG